MAAVKMSWMLRIVMSMVLVGLVALNLRVLMMEAPGTRDLELQDREDCKRPIVLSVKGGTGVDSYNASGMWLKYLNLDPSHVKVLGNHRAKKGFLTVGVPSIKRINGMTYLIQTINSLIENTSSFDKTRVVVIVFLADLDAEYNEQVARALLEKYTDYVNIGFLQVVQASKSYYPELSNLKRNFKDAADRVTWRAKQVADFSFMFMYAKNISTFYVQIEDDVICADNFVTAIETFIEDMDKNRKVWAVLEFSELGFIGKMLRSADLPKLAHYLMTFYEEQPVDWLMTYFRLSMAQRAIIMRKPTLFQHIGLKSSFDTSKDNKLKDRFFDSGQSTWKSDDPPGYIVSDMSYHQTFTPDMIYAAAGSYFWAKKPTKGKSITLVFEDNQLLDHVIVETGSESNPKDILLNGTLEASPKFLKHDVKHKRVNCAQWHVIASFENGRAQADDLPVKLRNKPTRCLRIVVDAQQRDWIVFRQLAVYVVNRSKPAVKA